MIPYHIPSPSKAFKTDHVMFTATAYSPIAGDLTHLRYQDDLFMSSVPLGYCEWNLQNRTDQYGQVRLVHSGATWANGAGCWLSELALRTAFCIQIGSRTITRKYSGLMNVANVSMARVRQG